jgi:hypothetical protein
MRSRIAHRGLDANYICWYRQDVAGFAPGYEVAGLGGPPKIDAALRFSAFAFSFSA